MIRRVASRLDSIEPFRVMDILARAKRMQLEGADVIHMEVGEPDFEAPPLVQAAAQKAIQQGLSHYTAATGLPELRQAIADYYAEALDQIVDPRRIIITPGASGALQLVMSALLDIGDEVLLQAPGYPCNRHMATLLGADSVELPAMPDGFDVKSAATAISNKTRAMMLASPANPTGEVISLTDLEVLYQSIQQSLQTFLIVDEIYQGLQYGAVQPETALSLDADRLFVINSFSKFFGMTGFRLGWAVVPEDFVDAMDRLAQNLFLAPPTISQYAALAAFSDENLALLESRRAIFESRRDHLHQGLKDLGLNLGEAPAGAFYLYADLDGLTEDSEAFCTALLSEQAVAITPGTDFAGQAANKKVRFAYTCDHTCIDQGLERLGKFLNSL